MDYGIAKSINAIGTVAGWGLVGLGAISFFVTAQSDFLAAMFSGGILSFSGLALVAMCQMANATIHTAEESKTTNDLLRELLKNSRSPNFPSARDTTTPPVKANAKPDDVSPNLAQYAPRPDDQIEHVKVYKGHTIQKVAGTRIFLADGRDFSGILAAEKHIDSLN